MSNLYTMQHGTLMMNPDRQFLSTPLIKLGEIFQKVNKNYFSIFYRGYYVYVWYIQYKYGRLW